MAPHIIPSSTESHVTIGPRTLKDMLEHFPHSKSSKGDPQLLWLFAANDVKIKSMELGGVKSRSQISTEISMSADEFDTYMICNPPLSLAFHLREFNATIALAESMSVALDLRFTESAAPIFIEFDTGASEESDYLFVISTSQAVFDSPSTSGAANRRKRDREDEHEGTLQAVRRKSLRAAVNATSAVAAQQQQPQSINSSSAGRSPAEDIASISGAPAQWKDTEPLFMPGSSQLSHADLDVLRHSGLGIEHMDYDEFEAMMEDEGEEVGMSTAVRNDEDVQWGEKDQESNGVDENGEHDQMGPSQAPVKRRGEKEFRPLFDD